MHGGATQKAVKVGLPLKPLGSAVQVGLPLHVREVARQLHGRLRMTGVRGQFAAAKSLGERILRLWELKRIVENEQILYREK